jgi:predicted nucleotidyltransferase
VGSRPLNLSATCRFAHGALHRYCGSKVRLHFKEYADFGDFSNRAGLKYGQDKVMASQTVVLDWSITEEKVAEALERILAVSNPVRIVAFGSRARGDFQQDSDLDLAVILDSGAAEAKSRLSSALQGISASIDLLVTDMEHHKLFSPWLNSVHYDIENEGVILYDRDHDKDKRPDRSAIQNIVE